MHRSGTTFLGKVFDNLSDCFVLHEPFNRKYGLEGLSYDYCDLKYDDKANELFNLLINNQRLKFKSFADRDGKLKSLARRYIGGRTEIQWFLFKTYYYRKQLILKDPFLSKSTHFLSDTYNSRSIVLVRHPCAVWNSIKKMRWTMDMTKYSSIIKSKNAVNLKDNIEKFCYVWNDIAVYNATPNKNIKLIYHENLCLNPLETIEECIDFFNFAPGKEVFNFVKNNMFAKDKDRNHSKLHQFKRNAFEINNQWKSELSTAEINKILKFTKEAVYLHYER